MNEATTRSLISFGLTEPQKRHLREMLSPSGDTLYWHPANQGEHACAATLRRKGLLRRDALTYSSAYFLTEDGLRIARELQA